MDFFKKCNDLQALSHLNKLRTQLVKLVHWLEAFNNYSCQYLKVSFPTKLALSFSPLSKLKAKENPVSKQ